MQKFVFITCKHFAAWPKAKNRKRIYYVGHYSPYRGTIHGRKLCWPETQVLGKTFGLSSKWIYYA